MARAEVMVFTAKLARSIALGYTPRVTRSRDMVFTRDLTRSIVLVFTTAVARSFRLVFTVKLAYKYRPFSPFWKTMSSSPSFFLACLKTQYMACLVTPSSLAILTGFIPCRRKSITFCCVRESI